MATIVFRSDKARYRVYFPPERHGMMDIDAFERDRNGSALIDAETSKPIRQRRAHPSAQFDGGMIALDDSVPSDARKIANLRQTIVDGRAAGRLSDDRLYEEEPELTAIIDASAGAIIVTVPAEMDDEDRALIFGTEKGPGLMTYFHNPIPVPAAKGAFALLDRALQRYEVRGIVSPTPERAKKQLRSRIVDLIYALEDAGMPLDTEKKPAKRGKAGRSALALAPVAAVVGGSGDDPNAALHGGEGAPTAPASEPEADAASG